MRINILILAFLTLGSVCSAQTKKTEKSVQEKSNEMTEKLDKKVKLSSTQKTKIKVINDAYVKERKAVDDKIKILEIELKKLKKARKIKIDAILTDNQKRKLESSKKKRKTKTKTE